MEKCKHGQISKCIECKRESRRKWYKTNSNYAKEFVRDWRKQYKEYTQLWAVEYRARLKYEVLSHYANGSLKCNCCDEKNFIFLCIDHINGGGNEHRRQIKSGKSLIKASGSAFYQWLKKSNYPSGYQVLCRNCNEGKHINGICPHKIEKKCKRCDVFIKPEEPWMVFCGPCQDKMKMAGHSSRQITVNGETKFLHEWAALTGIGRTVISQRIKYGWTIEQALGLEPRPKIARSAE